MADISQLEVNGTTYDICDATARDSLSNYVLKIGDTMTGALTVEDEVTATDANDVAHNLTEKANQSDVDTALAGKVSKSGDTMTGALTVNDVYYYAKSSNINRDGTYPSSATYGTSRYTLTDKDGETVGQIRAGWASSNRTLVQIGAVNKKTDGSAEVANWLTLYANRDGTYTYGVSNQAAFRSAIGLGEDKTWTTLASSTGFYIKYAKYRGIVFVAADSRGGKTASSSGYTSLGTLPSGYRPGIEFWSGSGTLGSSNTFTVNVTTAGKVSINCSGSGGDFWSFMICFPVA